MTARERRHPLKVTADRLADHAEQWGKLADEDITQELLNVQRWLEEIATVEPGHDPYRNRRP